MINGAPNHRYTDNTQGPHCNHRGNTRLAGHVFLMLRCLYCNRWCEIPVNWFSVPAAAIDIVTEL